MLAANSSYGLALALNLGYMNLGSGQHAAGGAPHDSGGEPDYLIRTAFMQVRPCARARTCALLCTDSTPSFPGRAVAVAGARQHPRPGGGPG